MAPKMNVCCLKHEMEAEKNQPKLALADDVEVIMPLNMDVLFGSLVSFQVHRDIVVISM